MDEMYLNYSLGNILTLNQDEYKRFFVDKCEKFLGRMCWKKKTEKKIMILRMFI